MIKLFSQHYFSTLFFTCKCGVVTDSVGAANIQDVSNVAYCLVLLLPVLGLLFVSICPYFDVCGERNDHPIYINWYQIKINVIFKPM